MPEQHLVYTTTDDRRNKRYGHTLEYIFRLPEVMPRDNGIGEYDMRREMKAHVEKLVSEEAHVSIEHYGPRWETDDQVTRFNVRIFWQVDRPSNIVDEASAKAALPIEQVTATVAHVWTQLVQMGQDAADRKQAEERAANLVSWARDEVYEEAKAACRFEQRLAALKAELKAEVACSVEKKIAEVVRTIEDDEEWSDYRGLPAELLQEHGPKVIKDSPAPGFFSSRSSVEGDFRKILREAADTKVS